MNAIEVLKDKLSDARYYTCMDNPEKNDEDILAFKEAIVALKQKEKCEDDLQSMVMVAEDKARKQGALGKLKVFDEVLEELHMDIYGHDWSKRQILECIVKNKNKVEKEIKELECEIE